MTEIKLSIDSYLERIDYKGSTSVSEDTLRDLHIAHTTNVPFENLDVFYKKPVLLDEKSLFTKIVENRRGGYCFEMNGIFSLVLQKLGFKVTNLLARGTFDGITYFAKMHQAILVEIGDIKWLADVGYGNDGIIAPLLLQENTDQDQFAHTYKLIRDPKFGYVLQKKNNNKYDYLYAFTLDECYPMDFLMSNHFTSTYPDSFFLKMRMCTMPTKEGRITLTDNHYKTIINGKTTEIPVANDEEFNTLLINNFKLDLNKLGVL
jgi:N-hydroxyarylamine O-acetyltransferase